MKYWIVMLIAWPVAVFLVGCDPVMAAPVPYINDAKTVKIPVIQAEDGRYWETELQCDNAIRECVVIYAREICQIDITRFSPSFCWGFGR